MRRRGRKRDLEEKVIYINRVAKTAKGGRSIHFTALVVVGNRKGRVGVGTGKALEVPEAINKGVAQAKKNMVDLPLVGSTIPHRTVGRAGAGKVLLMPAKKGAGIIAGGPVRAICEVGGLDDIRAKSLGSANPKSIVNATMAGFAQMKTADQVARLRGKTPEEL